MFLKEFQGQLFGAFRFPFLRITDECASLRAYQVKLISLAERVEI